jgi:hypothetical protein
MSCRRNGLSITRAMSIRRVECSNAQNTETMDSNPSLGTDGLYVFVLSSAGTGFEVGRSLILEFINIHKEYSEFQKTESPGPHSPIGPRADGRMDR